MTHATPAEVLVMDLGGVTCGWVPDRRLHALAQLSGFPPATVDDLVFVSGFDDAGERGQYDLASFLAELQALLGLSDDEASVARLRAAWGLAFEPDVRVLDLIARSGPPAALFTNNGPLLELALDHELAGVGQAFDRLLFSWHLRATKPDPAAFAAATDALGVAPGAIVFVDDSEANVDAARAAGWQAHRFTDALNLTAALARSGVL